MMRYLSKLMVILLATALLASCTQINRAFKQSNQATQATQQQVDQARRNQNTTDPSVISRKGYYVDTTPIALDNNPTWTNKHIRLQGQNLPLSFILSRILRNTPASVDYRTGINPSKTVSLNYRGTIKGALDSLALKTNYAYTIEDNQVVWSRFVTKTFNISFMPGSSTYLVGQTQGTTNVNSSDTDVSTIKGNLDDEQYSSLQGSVSVWNDLRQTLQSLKSKAGTIDVSESTTTVTVHDYPANVQAMADYIQQLNANLSRQVALKVRVLEVDLDDAHKYGIDWNLIEHALGSRFSLTGNITDSLAASGVATSTTNMPSFTIGHHSNFIINALGQQGKVSIVTEPTVVTMNNQVAEVRISRDTSYLKSIENTISGSSTLSSTSMTPGVVTDGFTLYLLPKIQGKHVYLQISSLLSNLQKIENVSSSSVANNANASQIQVPTLSEKRFNMRALISNGRTLIIAGFKQLRNETHQSQMFGSSDLGGRGADKNNAETIVLITPTIIENKN